MVYPYLAPIALGAIACLASQASAQYVTITTGYCGDQGHQNIYDMSECESAAQELSIFPFGQNYSASVLQPTTSYIPRGCSFKIFPETHPDYPSRLIIRVADVDGYHCGRLTDGCICKAGVAAETTTTSSSSTTPVTSTETATLQTTTGFLAPTPFTTTTSGALPSCLYKFLVDTAVKGWATGGEKLKRASYESDADYLDACRAECNANSKCKGFVDDLTEGRPRMCKPKTSTRWAYDKPQKNFYVKGLGC